jgi:arsenate reductase
MKKKVLFICTHNAARSQMAEGLLREMLGDRYEAYSAGVEPLEVSTVAIETMAEIGIDISGHRSKSVKEFLGMQIDYIVTVCDYAQQTCPFFPGGKNYIHKSFTDPGSMKGDRDKRLELTRKVRDEIKEWIQEIFN